MTTVLVNVLEMLKQANAVLELEVRRAVAGGHAFSSMLDEWADNGWR